MTLSNLSPILFISLAACVISLACFIVFVSRKRRIACWSAAVITLAAAFVAYSAFMRLKDDYDELFLWAPQLHTKADLITRFGVPTQRTSYDFKGKEIECWIYTVPLLEPRVSIQFEFTGDAILGRSPLAI